MLLVYTPFIPLAGDGLLWLPDGGGAGGIVALGDSPVPFGRRSFARGTHDNLRYLGRIGCPSTHAQVLQVSERVGRINRFGKPIVCLAAVVQTDRTA